jgi:hypothetical protein
VVSLTPPTGGEATRITDTTGRVWASRGSAPPIVTRNPLSRGVDSLTEWIIGILSTTPLYTTIVVNATIVAYIAEWITGRVDSPYLPHIETIHYILYRSFLYYYPLKTNYLYKKIGQNHCKTRVFLHNRRVNHNRL